MPGVHCCCQAGKRPATVHLLAALRVTATVSSHPGKAKFITIAKAMVAKYDQALADFIQEVRMMVVGATSLFHRLVGKSKLLIDTLVII